MILSRRAQESERRQANPEAAALADIAATLDRVSAALEALARRPEIEIPEIHMPMAAPTVVIERPKAWEITIERDRMGRLQGTLKAVETI